MRFKAGIFSFVIILLFATSSFAAVFYVKQDSAGQVLDGTSWDTAYHTVQMAVDAAPAGSEVWVAKGSYSESVNLKTGISLQGGYSGVGSERDIKANLTKIISCNITGASTLEGFTVEGSTESGVCCSGTGTSVVRANTITGSQTFGIYSSNPLTAEKNKITNSAALAFDYGIYCIGNTFCRISANRVSGQNTGISCGVGYLYNNVVSNTITGILTSGTSVYVLNNLVCDNCVAGIALGAAGFIYNNIVSNNGCGIENRSGGTTNFSVYNNDVYANKIDYSTYITHGTTNISADPKFENPDAEDYRLAPGSPCIDKGSSPILSGKNITTDFNGQPRTYGTYVDIGPCEFSRSERISVGPSNGLVCISDPGAAASGSLVYSIYNLGTQSIYWSASKTADWISISPESGNLGSNQSTDFVVSTNSAARTLPAGRYSDAVTFTNSANSEIIVRNINLIVGSAVCVDSRANGTLHDGTSWQTAYKTINEAIIAAQPGQTIKVAKGTYSEYLIIRKNVILEGGYYGVGDQGIYSPGTGDSRDIAANETIIKRPDSYGDTLTCESACSIDGFTITSGYDGVWGTLDSTVNISNCTLKSNSNSGVTLEYANGTVSSCKATENRYGMVLCSNLSNAVNNLVYKNSSYGMQILSNATAVNNTCSANGESGIYYDVVSSGSFNNLVWGNYANYSVETRPYEGQDPLFIDAENGNYRLAKGSAAIDAGTSAGAPLTDIEGYPRPMNGISETGTAKWDLGCYEAPSYFINPSKLKSLPNGYPVRLQNVVSTAAFSDRIYVESSNGASGIGVLGNGAIRGHRVGVDGVLDTVNGERVIRPSKVFDYAVAGIPAPWFINYQSLGGGPLGLQSGLQEWRWIPLIDELGNPHYERKLINFSGANNIGLLVKTTGRVRNRLNFMGKWIFTIGGELGSDDSAVQVDWPFSNEPPANGALVSIIGISSCSLLPDEEFGDIVTRLLRPISPELVVTLD